MKLTYLQLTPHLKNNLSTIYIVSGDEIVLKNEALYLIRKKAQQSGFKQRIRLSHESGLTPDSLYSLLHTNSLIPEKQLIELDFRDILPNKSMATILTEYTKHLSPNIILVVELNKVDQKIAKTNWLQALVKTGTHVTIWPLPREQLPQWLIERALKYKLILPKDVALFLVEHIEGNLVAASQYLEKLFLLEPTAPITIQNIKNILMDESRFSIFDFMDSLIAQDATRSLHILLTLKAEGVEPILILWIITRELRTLANMAYELKQGISYLSILQKYKIFPQRQSLIRNWLSKFNLETCFHFLEHAAEIDKILKGAVPGNCWLALQAFCYEFTGGPNLFNY